MGAKFRISPFEVADLIALGRWAAAYDATHWLAFTLTREYPNNAIRVQIFQVLLNLLRNACPAMRKQPDRRIVISSDADGPDFVRISIAERGLGIATALEHSALKPFTAIKTGVTVTASPPHNHCRRTWQRIWHTPDDCGRCGIPLHGRDRRFTSFNGHRSEHARDRPCVREA